MYNLTFIINGKTIKKRSASVEDAILQVAPELVHTEMYITVKKGKHVSEQYVPLIAARKLFRDPTYRSIFINNLLYGL